MSSPYLTYMQETEEMKKLTDKLDKYNGLIQNLFKEEGGFEFLLSLSDRVQRLLQSKLVYAEKFSSEHTLYFIDEKGLAYRIIFYDNFSSAKNTFRMEYKNSNTNILSFPLNNVRSDSEIHSKSPFKEEEARLIRSVILSHVGKIEKIAGDLIGMQDNLYEAGIKKMLEGKRIEEVSIIRSVPHVRLDTGEQHPLNNLLTFFSDAYQDKIFEVTRRY